MQMRTFVAAIAIVGAASVATAGGPGWPNETPNPNPQFNADGTQTWYIGFNTQYPFLQDAIDAAAPGDELVIYPGLYVESVVVNTPDLTIRPFCLDWDQDVSWLPVTMWNPTEGFENENAFAVNFGSNTNNTYFGRPRQYTQLSNGTTVLTEVPINEWIGGPGDIYVGDIEGPFDFDAVLEFWSRSIENVAVLCDPGAQATVQQCSMTGATGFGGCVMAIESTMNFVDCQMFYTNAPGALLNGLPVNVVTLVGGNNSFDGCMIGENVGGQDGIILQVGGENMWRACIIGDNLSISGWGTYTNIGGTPSFYRCGFYGNDSRFGTVFTDSLDSGQGELTEFSECEFEWNATMDGQYGGAYFAVNNNGTVSPRVHFDGCRIKYNNGHSGNNQFDIETPYFPEYRIGRDINSGLPLGGSGSLQGDINDDGHVDGSDMGLLLANWTF